MSVIDLFNFDKQFDKVIIGTDEAGQGINDLVSVVCWYREAPKGSPRRLMCGLQFRFADESEHKVLADYVGNIKNVYKLKA